jgi:hypothetical protein
VVFVEKPTRLQINCSICNQAVALEIAKTDDFGRTVHEQCYVLKLGSSPAEPPSNTQNKRRPPMLQRVVVAGEPSASVTTVCRFAGEFHDDC